MYPIWSYFSSIQHIKYKWKSKRTHANTHVRTPTFTSLHIGGLVQDCSISSALAILQSCTKPYRYVFRWHNDYTNNAIIINDNLVIKLQPLQFLRGSFLHHFILLSYYWPIPSPVHDVAVGGFIEWWVNTMLTVHDLCRTILFTLGPWTPLSTAKRGLSQWENNWLMPCWVIERKRTLLIRPTHTYTVKSLI